MTTRRLWLIAGTLTLAAVLASILGGHMGGFLIPALTVLALAWVGVPQYRAWRRDRDAHKRMHAEIAAILNRGK